ASMSADTAAFAHGVTCAGTTASHSVRPASRGMCHPRAVGRPYRDLPSRDGAAARRTVVVPHRPADVAVGDRMGPRRSASAGVVRGDQYRAPEPGRNARGGGRAAMTLRLTPDAADPRGGVPPAVALALVAG